MITGIFSATGELIEIEAVGRDIDELKITMEKLEEANEEICRLNQRLESENFYLKDRFGSKSRLPGFLSRDPRMLKMLEHLKNVAMGNGPVLLAGEKGVGKNLLAQTIHKFSQFRKSDIYFVDCKVYTSGLPVSLMKDSRSEGLSSRLVSYLKRADKTTLYLNEITLLPPEMQFQLLEMARTGEFLLPGEENPRKAEIRFIAATTRDPREAVADGSLLREWTEPPLVQMFQLPPLRERKEDIPVLVWEFVLEYSVKLGKRIEGIPKTGMERLMRYPWPGNVRELREVIGQSVVMSDSPILDIRLPGEQAEEEDLYLALSSSETQRILMALEKSGWRIRGRGGAAELLGVAESTLRYRMKKLGIERENR
jgi:DNA-binding NtrC family response regulator